MSNSTSLHDIITMVTLDYVGRIEWLGLKGTREIIEYTSASEIRAVIAEELHYGVPIKIVLYANEAGDCVRLNFEDYGCMPKGYEVIPLPNSHPEILTERWQEGCRLSSFKIGDTVAAVEDFGKMKDVAPEKATLVFGGIAYECGDMRFLPKRPMPEVLKKYNITVAGYNEVCAVLEKELCIGSCDFCN